MPDNLGDFRLPTRPDFTIQPFKEINSTTPELPSPALIPQAVVPKVGPGKRRKWLGRISHETPGCVGVETQHERDKEMMRVPKRLKGLLPDPSVGGGVHEQHTQQHDMARDSAGLGIMDLDGSLRAKLMFLDIEEARRGVSQSSLAIFLSSVGKTHFT